MSDHIPTTGNGKGDTPRRNLNQEAYRANWERIFGERYCPSCNGKGYRIFPNDENVCFGLPCNYCDGTGLEDE